MSAAARLSSHKIMDALQRSFGMIAPAAHGLGVSPQTLRRRIEQQPDLMATGVDAHTTDLALAAALAGIQRGDLAAAKWWLVRRDRSFSIPRNEARIVRVDDPSVPRAGLKLS